MRKLSALAILIVVFFPLVFAAMTLASIRPWILDRGFYERIVNDEHLYESALTEELPRRFNREAFTDTEQLPVSALSIALREVLTPDYLRTQSTKIVNDVFDYLEGREDDFSLSLDIAPVKAALAGESRVDFANALAAALPTCDAGQEPTAPGGRLTRCIAVDGSVGATAEQIASNLPAVLEDTPDKIVLGNQWPVRMNWYFFWPRGISVSAGLDIAIITILVVAVAIGLADAYLGGDDLRGRLKWLSAALVFPASLFLAAGLILTSSLAAGLIQRGLITADWGAPYSQAFREAVTGVIIPVVQQVGSGILLTGVVAILIACGVLVLSLFTPASGQQNPRIVQVPVRNP